MATKQLWDVYLDGEFWGRATGFTAHNAIQKLVNGDDEQLLYALDQFTAEPVKAEEKCDESK